jgi:hypothetical protein
LVRVAPASPFDDRNRETVADVKDNAIIVKELPASVAGAPTAFTPIGSGRTVRVAGGACFAAEEFWS